MDQSDQPKQFAALGQKVTTFKGFETFPAPPGCQRVRAISDEVTSICPVTNQPDFYTVEIDYCPRAVCLESKTIKLYLQSFRDVGHFCEKLSSIMAIDIAKALDTEVNVTIQQKSRGGVTIIAKSTGAPRPLA